MKSIIGISLIVIGLVLASGVYYLRSNYSNTTRPFSQYTILTSAWEKYKGQFINQDGRVIDHSTSMTTSEGQSYALLRAVWVDDKPAFDLVWKWTSQNLQLPNSNLFGWKWGQTGDKYGFLPDGGNNTASDADSDIALALILASRRWQEPAYQQQAIKILQDIWQRETAVAGGKRYLVAGNWAEGDKEIVINPSYFAPYAYRIFAEVDSKHDWQSLIDPGYDLLDHSTKANLDNSSSANLPPNWIIVDKSSGDLKPPQANGFNTDYSFDAVRVPWRIGLDYQWNQEPKALAYLQNNFTVLKTDYQTNLKLPESYHHDGTHISENENPTMYATSLGYFAVTDPDIARKIYQEKILNLYSNDKSSFNPDIPYYEQNWLWFGTAFINNQLSNFAK